MASREKYGIDLTELEIQDIVKSLIKTVPKINYYYQDELERRQSKLRDELKEILQSIKEEKRYESETTD